MSIPYTTLSATIDLLECDNIMPRSGASSQGVYSMADVSGAVRDAHKSTGTGGNASWGNNEAVIISCPKIPSENIAFNPSDFPRTKPKDRTFKIILKKKEWINRGRHGVWSNFELIYL